MSASVSDQENMTGQEYKSILKENTWNQELLPDAKGQGWMVISYKDIYSRGT